MHFSLGFGSNYGFYLFDSGFNLGFRFKYFLLISRLVLCSDRVTERIREWQRERERERERERQRENQSP